MNRAETEATTQPGSGLSVSAPMGNTWRHSDDVVEPTIEGWKVYAVKDNPSSFINRKSLPEEWAGKRDAALAAVTGVSDAVFCHNKRFMAVAKSKEGALALAHQAISL